MVSDVDKHVFKVSVNIYGKRHTEEYSIPGSHIGIAKDLGLFESDNDFVTYFDWKPLGGMKDIYGNEISTGVKSVKEFRRDDKYLYAITDDKTFSLPKYMEKDLKRKDFILFGKREK